MSVNIMEAVQISSLKGNHISQGFNLVLTWVRQLKAMCPHKALPHSACREKHPARRVGGAENFRLLNRVRLASRIMSNVMLRYVP